MKEVNATIKFNSGILSQSFDTCEEAWLWVRETVKWALNRRAINDRETCIEAYYDGETITGKRYGGILNIKGNWITPDNRVNYAKYYPAPFEMMESFIKGGK